MELSLTKPLLVDKCQIVKKRQYKINRQNCYPCFNSQISIHLVLKITLKYLLFVKITK